MDTAIVPHTFVRSVKARDLSFDYVNPVLEEVRTCKPHGVHGTWVAQVEQPNWVIMGFADPSQSRNTLKVLACGSGTLSDQSKWPVELFSPSALCYGLYRVLLDDDEGSSAGILSFCWKGRSLPIYLRTKYTEFNQLIKKHLGAATHIVLQYPEDLHDRALLKSLPPRRKRTTSRRFISNEFDSSPEVSQAIADIRSDTSPYNWIVCGYEGADNAQRLVVIEKGMAGLFALKGLGGITSVLKEGCTMYIYLRVDIPLHHGSEHIVSKYVLVTWQTNLGETESLQSDDELFEVWRGPLSSDGSSSNLLGTETSNSTNSKLQRAATAHIHGSEVYRLFPHHVHFFASTLSEISDEAIRERVRRAVDNDFMLIRVVCIQASGDTQAPLCLEVPFDADVALLRRAIAAHVGIPEERQRIAWIRQIDCIENEYQRSSQALLLEDDSAKLRKQVGLGHGDKIHVDDKYNGENSVLARLVDQINQGSAVVSLSAERRHEVQRSVEAREAELKRILSVTHDLIRRRTSRAQLPLPRSTSSTSEICSLEHDEAVENPHRSRRANSLSSDDDHQADYASLQEQARVLESQNQYLEIPYESIRILGGKENELGCGKAATVYRGLWMSRNGAAEVAIKVFRYVRLTDKILGDYTQEVALLRKLRHPNIVLFIGACTNPKLMILTEYCSRKSLYEVIHSPSFATMPWRYKVRMMLDAARGIQYLHSKRIIHRDIKSHNFLVDDDWRVKVADFGISKVLDNDTNAFTQCGTTGWVAPEVLLDEDLGYTFKADNWSFAIVMWEMVAGDNTNPFIGMAPIKFYQQTITQGKRPAFPDAVDESYRQLVTDCWNSNAADRPSFSTIVSSLEKMLLDLGGSVDLPPTFQGGYHHALAS